MEFDLTAIVPLFYHLVVSIFVFGSRISFFGRFQCFVFCCCSAVSCDLVFSRDGMSTCPSTLPSCLYPLNVSLICLKVKDMS